MIFILSMLVSNPNKAFSAKPTLLGNRMSVFWGFRKLRKVTFRKEMVIFDFFSNNRVDE